MDRKKLLIAFAGQKGGSGKTTLCMLFANYLAKKGLKVFVGDLDTQHSFYKVRKLDMILKPDMQMPYEVQSYRLAMRRGQTPVENEKYVLEVLDEIKEKGDFCILDTPGTLNEDWLITVFQNVDYLIAPFSYDRASWESLVDFIKVCYATKVKFDAHFKTFFVLNKYDQRFGRTEERKLWLAMDKALSKRGILTPRVKYMADMGRINTYELAPGQQKAVCRTFKFILDTITKEADHEEDTNG